MGMIITEGLVKINEKDFEAVLIESSENRYSKYIVYYNEGQVMAHFGFDDFEKIEEVIMLGDDSVKNSSLVFPKVTDFFQSGIKSISINATF